MLGGLALKWRWRERMRAAGRPTDRPNLVAGINVQVCWEKFCRYWDVEPRLAPMEGDRFTLDAERGRGALRREHDRRVGDPRLDLRRQLRAGGRDRSGARRARAAARDQRPDPRRRRLGRVRRAVHPARPVWDFRLPRVQSINASGPQVRADLPRGRLGAVARRNALPADLVFDVNYLGGHMPTFALNFSRPGSEVVTQYLMFASLGRDGYRAVQERSSEIARRLASVQAVVMLYILDRRVGGLGRGARSLDRWPRCWLAAFLDDRRMPGCAENAALPRRLRTTRQHRPAFHSHDRRRGGIFGNL